MSFQNEDELVKAKVLMSFFRLIEQELKRPENSKTLFEKLWLETDFETDFEILNLFDSLPPTLHEEVYIVCILNILL